MLPTQILLNNLLYDLSQITIPTDNVDDEFVRTPAPMGHRLRSATSCSCVGPVSSIYDFLDVLRAPPLLPRVARRLFHTGWFVESLATQTLVIFVIRTMRNPLRSRPSLALMLTTLTVVAVGCVLPFTPLAEWLGFEPLPGAFFAFLIAATFTYLALVEVAKRWLSRQAHHVHGGEPIAPRAHDFIAR